MQKILVLSDSHRNLRILENVLEANLDCDIIIHLGDDYEDMDNFPNLTKGKEVIKVPGIFHPKYKDGSLPKQKEISFAGKKIILVHSEDDIEGTADLYLFGHTHNWELSNSKKGVYFNPGHLHSEEEKGLPSRSRPRAKPWQNKATAKQGRIASYGIIEINEEKFKITMLSYQHKPILQAEI